MTQAWNGLVISNYIPAELGAQPEILHRNDKCYDQYPHGISPQEVARFVVKRNDITTAEMARMRDPGIGNSSMEVALNLQSQHNHDVLARVDLVI